MEQVKSNEDEFSIVLPLEHIQHWSRILQFYLISFSSFAPLTSFRLTAKSSLVYGSQPSIRSERHGEPTTNNYPISCVITLLVCESSWRQVVGHDRNGSMVVVLLFNDWKALSNTSLSQLVIDKLSVYLGVVFRRPSPKITRSPSVFNQQGDLNTFPAKIPKWNLWHEVLELYFENDKFDKRLPNLVNISVLWNFIEPPFHLMLKVHEVAIIVGLCFTSLNVSQCALFKLFRQWLECWRYLLAGVCFL